MPNQPRSAIFRQSSGEYPLSLASSSLTTVVGHSDSRKSRAVRLSISCGSLSPKSIVIVPIPVVLKTRCRGGPYLGSPRPRPAMIFRWTSVVPPPCMWRLSLLRPWMLPIMGAHWESCSSVP